MKSKWYELKEKAFQLRKQGLSIRVVEKNLGIPRSTLSGWFKNVKLSKKKKERLYKNWLKALVTARKKAALWHKTQKKARILEAERQASSVISKIDIDNKNIIDLALAMLYWGEGFKTQKTAIGNSDPTILKFFIHVLKKIYNLDISKIGCELHLRADQNPNIIKHFWARELELPLEKFNSVAIDIRTKGTKTYPNYKGVCIVRYPSLNIQRKLLAMSKLYCKEVMGG